MSKAHDKTHLDEVLHVADKGLLARCDELLSNPATSAALLSLLERIGQQYTVNVFPQVLEKLQAANALTVAEEGKLRVLCLDRRYYSAQFGLSTEPVSLMEFLNA